jgi:multidrug efflux pump subunit AcrA (membrane-fusion protein)
VPAAAIARRGGGSVVFALQGGEVRQVPVTAGPRLGDLVAVRGIAAGQKVVLRPPPRLAGGMHVERAKK